MFVRHRLSYCARHMFIELPEGLFLVDTGSPVTFGRTGTATYGDSRVAIPRQCGSLEVGMLRGLHLEEQLGRPIDGLIGMDLMSKVPVLWDGPAGEAVVGHDDTEPGASVLSAPLLHGAVPVVESIIEGRRMRMLFDTGAQYGYMTERSDLRMGVDAGPFDDFHPILKEIRTDSIHAEVALIADEGEPIRFTERFGHDESLSAAILRKVGVDGIVGCSWLPRHRVWLNPVWFNPVLLDRGSFNSRAARLAVA
jgi:hypothetical protein